MNGASKASQLLFKMVSFMQHVSWLELRPLQTVGPGSSKIVPVLAWQNAEDWS